MNNILKFVFKMLMQFNQFYMPLDLNYYMTNKTVQRNVNWKNFKMSAHNYRKSKFY